MPDSHIFFYGITSNTSITEQRNKAQRQFINIDIYTSPFDVNRVQSWLRIQRKRLVIQYQYYVAEVTVYEAT